MVKHNIVSSTMLVKKKITSDLNKIGKKLTYLKYQFGIKHSYHNRIGTFE